MLTTLRTSMKKSIINNVKLFALQIFYLYRPVDIKTGSLLLNCLSIHFFATESPNSLPAASIR